MTATVSATAVRTPEPGIEPAGIDTPTLVMWGFVSVVLVVCVMLAAAALFWGVQANFNTKRLIAPSYVDADKLYSDQQGVLASYGAPTTEGQPYRIPVDRAKRLVLQELRGGD